MQRCLMMVVVCGCVVGAVGCGGNDSTGPSEQERELQAIRQATAAFKDSNAAVGAGYLNTKVCVTAAMEGRPASDGAMGIHFFHPGLYGAAGFTPPIEGTDAVMDMLRPEVLLYEPQPGGRLELVGVEYIVSARAWRAAGNSRPPRVAGFDFEFMQDNPATQVDEAHGFAPHYELHLWTERPNPRGGINGFMNPAVSCQHAGHSGGQG